MSLDLRILPSGPERPDPGGILETWASHGDDTVRSSLGVRPHLIRLSDRAPVPMGERIEPGASYLFQLSEPNTLTMTDVPLDSWTDVEAETQDFGRNLSETDRQAVAAAWRRAGYSIWVQSMGGRGPRELGSLHALVCGLATLCRGWIMIENAAFSGLAVGIYRPDELATRPFRLLERWR